MFAFLAWVFGFAVTVIWLIIGWRAMRAHEKLAEAAELTARQNSVPPPLR